MLDDPLDNRRMTDTPLEHVPCTVCGADQPTHVMQAPEFLYGQGDLFGIVRCGQCGLKYTSPRPTMAAIGRFYPDDYYRDGQRPKAKRPDRQTGWRERWAQAAMRCHMGYPGTAPAWLKLLTWPRAWRLKRGLRDHDTLPWIGQGRLLDFGCGDARFLRLQRDRGWTVAGIDFNEIVVKWAREEDDIEAEAGTWPSENEPMRGRQFDTITAWHVLEHVPDPPGWVAAAAKRLAPGGVLLICCPDSDSWAYERFGEDWFGLDVPRHFSHFTKHDLAKLLRDAGLEVIRIRPQHRSRPLKESVRMHADRKNNAMWGVLRKLKPMWRLYGWLAALCGKADCVIVYGRKPS